MSTATLTLTTRMNDDDRVTITNLTPEGEGGDAKVYGRPAGDPAAK